MLRPKRARVARGRSTLGPFGPEQRMWAVSLIGALKDLTVEEYREEERLWFESESEEVKSFVWVCQVLGLSKSRIREEVKKILEGDEQLIRKWRKRRTPDYKEPQKAA